MRVFGLSVIAVLVAGVAFNAISFAWYAYLFGDEWIVSHGFARDAAHGGSPVWRMISPLLAFAQVIGLAFVLRWCGVTTLAGAAGTSLWMAVLFAVPVLAYDPVNLPSHNVTAFAIDAGHLMVAWLVAGAILTAMRPED